MFLSIDLSKTRKFYEFILVDTNSIQISHIKNQEGTYIAYTKCKILKVIYEKDWGQNPFTHKTLSQNFIPQTFDYFDYKVRSIILFISNHLPTHGFFIGKKKFKLIFQIGFKNGGISWVMSLIYYVSKSKSLLISSKKIVIA